MSLKINLSNKEKNTEMYIAFLELTKKEFQIEKNIQTESDRLCQM